MENEIDIDLIKEYRESGASEEEILKILMQDGNGQLRVNDDYIDLNAAIEGGVSSTDLLDYLTSGKTIRADIDTKGKAKVAGLATGLSNLIGLPGELVNPFGNLLESGVRYGGNYLASLNAPEGVTDPSHPNYDPDFYMSTKPEDYIFNKDKAFLGGQMVREGIEAVANPLYRKVGLKEIDYVDSREEIREDLRPSFSAMRVVGENVVPTLAMAKAAQIGYGLANPIMQGIRNNQGKFLIGEGLATTGAAGGAALTETVGLGDNPYVMAGGEILGALVTGNFKTIAQNTPISLAYRGGKAMFKRAKSNWSDQAALDGAFEEFLKTADINKQSMLKEADARAANGETELAEALRAEAERFTPEIMFADLETALNQTGTVGQQTAGLPIGSLTDNPVLQGIQQSMMGQSQQFNADIMKRANSAITGLLEISELLARAGNPQAANALRTRAYSNLVDITLTNANGNVTEALKAVKNANPEASSKIAQRALFGAKSNMREMETFLWDRIDKSQVVSGEAIGKIFDKIYGEKLLDGMTIAGGGQVDEAINIINQKIKSGQGIPVGDILKFRSIMLSNSRKAGAGDDFFQAGLFDELAGASIDELSKIEGSAGDAIGMARGFSVELNKRFNRYFPKDVLSKEASGGTSIREGDVLDTGFNSGGRDASTNFRELREATEVSDNLGPDLAKLREQDTANLNASSLGDDGTRTSNTKVATNDGVLYPENTSYPYRSENPEEFITEDGTRIFPPEGSADAQKLDKEFDRPEGATYSRSGPETATDDFKLNEGGQSADKTALTTQADNAPISLSAEMSQAQEDFLRGKVRDLAGLDNRITTEALEQFMKDNKELVQQFPKLKEDVLLIHDAQRTADKLVNDLSMAANSEKLPQAIGDVLATQSPIEGYSKLAREAITPEAKIDFRNATIDEVFRGAVKPDGSPDMLKIAESLLKPVSTRKGDINILDVMVQNGIMEAVEKDAMLELIAEGLRIEKGIRNPEIFNKVLSDTPDIQKNLARLAGANIGVLFGRGDASLQAASIGSGFLKKYIDQLPLGKQAEQLEILIKQPKLLAQMLSKNTKLRKTAMQAAKEYTDRIKELGLTGIIKEAVSNRKPISNITTAYPGALFGGDTSDQGNPDVSTITDQQMIELGLQ